MDDRKNYYGSLCTEMYEILHPEAPQDELAFYLSYARKGEKILEPLCGSGRFLVPFLQRGYDISGMDASREMLDQLRAKAPQARVTHAALEAYAPREKFDYIFISSGSVSLFTDMEALKGILRQMRALLNEGGKFVFAVDTVITHGEEAAEYKTDITVTTAAGHTLVLKGKCHYDAATHTQYSPSLYELYDGEALLQRESMDFQLHLYELGEMESLLQEAGFTHVTAYADYDKTVATDRQTDMLLYECSF